MKQEQVIELLKKHGVFVYETAPAFEMLQTSVNRIASVIAEVEQATLERAALECKNHLYAKNAGAVIRNLAKES